MSKIVIDEGNSLENLEIRLDHLLLGQKDLEAERGSFQSLEPLLDDRYRNFPPFLASSGKIQEAANLVEGKDEIELFFLYLLSDKNKTKMIPVLEQNRSAIGESLYQDFMSLIFLSTDEKTRGYILRNLLLLPTASRSAFVNFIIAMFSDEPQNINYSPNVEQHSALFLEAIKAENKGNSDKAFADMLTIFENSGYPKFIFELLRFYVMKYDNIAPERVERFINLVTESPLNISFTSLKFIEFLFYYRNNIFDKLEGSVSSLGESTDSLFILNAVAPLLYQYEKWHLLGKFYKLASRKTVGRTKVRYLELLADIYEHKLNMPDFAIEIHKSIVEDDPRSCSVSLSMVLSVYEDNQQWNDLYNLFKYLSERENEPQLKAYYFYRAGDLLFRELKKPDEARTMLEKSAELHRSFEVLRALSEIYLKMHDYDAYISNLLRELDLTTEPSQRVKLLDIIADSCITYKKDYTSAEKHLLELMKINNSDIGTIRKLGKLYYMSRNWSRLTEVNNAEISRTDNIKDRVNLLYKNGTIYFRELLDFDRAKDCFLQTIAIEATHIPSLLYLEKIYLRENNVKQLIELYRKLTQSSSQDSETREYYFTRLAVIYRDNGMKKEAIDTFRAILDSYPENTIAKENWRILSGDVRFTDFSFDEFDNSEISSMAEALTNHEKADLPANFVETAQNNFWKYLYVMKKGIKTAMPDIELTHQERMIFNMLESFDDIDVLIANNSKRTALIALAQKYLEKGYYKGIYTILAYYLKLNPETKRTFWSLFFMGRDNPDLKEKLETLLVSEKDFAYFEIALNMLEKIYLADKDYKTILFLRTVFAKKLKDNARQIEFIDETLKSLEGKLEKKDMLELYKFRYKISDKESKRQYLTVLAGVYKELQMQESLTRLYEEKWIAEKDITDGEHLLVLYTSANESEKAIELAKELAAADPERIDVFDKLINLYASQEQYSLAITALKHRIKNEKNPLHKEHLNIRLLELFLSTHLHDEALNLFMTVTFEKPYDKFDKGVELASAFLVTDMKEQALYILKSIAPANEEQAKKKIELFIANGEKCKEDDLKHISSYSVIAPLLERYKDAGAVSSFFIDYFSSKGDIASTEAMFLSLLDRGELDEAKMLFEKTLSSSDKNKMFESMILRHEKKHDEEKRLLMGMLKDELQKGSLYPLERLMEMDMPDKPRAGFFLINLLSSFSKGKCKPADNEWSRLYAIDKNIILSYLDFTEKDNLLLKYANLLAFASPRNTKKAIKEPLNPTTNKEIANLLQKVSLALGTDTIDAFYDKSMGYPVNVDNQNIPVLVFGEPAKSIPAKNLVFLIANTVFLMRNGVDEYNGRKGVDSAVERMVSSLSFAGKSKVTFIRSLKEKYQPDAIEMFNELENTPPDIIRAFGEKLYKASLLYAFSVVPDISVFIAAAESSGYFWDENSYSSMAFNFGLKKFLARV